MSGNAEAKATKTSTTIEFENATVRLQDVRREIGKVIFGQDTIVDQVLITLMSRGHVLLIGVPGLAKTLLVETAAKVLGLESGRIQCTPDLMPSDILGSEVLDEDENGKRHFRFIPGPVFSQFLMADEINRASPRTQSALLQAMQEKEVTVAGNPHTLPNPFHVLATQNPVEQEGIYPLPEAQLDRFLMQIDVDYPSEESERQILLATTTGVQNTVSSVMTPEQLCAIQNFVREMPIGEQVVDAILKLVRSLRPGESALDTVNNYVAWAPGPRGSQGLMLAVRAKALLEGRPAPSIDDVIALANPVLKHRMALNFKAKGENITGSHIIQTACDTL